MFDERMNQYGATVDYAELGRRFLEAAPVVLVVIDAGGAIRYVNAYFERLTGFSLAEIQGKEWFETFLPERDRARFRAQLSACYAGAIPRGNVNPIVTRSGEERQIEWTCEMMNDDQGNLAAMLSLGHDVTELVAARDALQVSEQGLAEAQRIANLGAWKLDLRTGVAWVSDEHARINGFPIGESVTMDEYTSRVHPDDRPAFEQSFATALATGKAELEYRFVLPGGDVRDIHSRARIIRDEHGEPITLVGTTQDVTERNRVEATARRASELLRAVVAKAPFVMFLLDRDGTFILCEGRALERLGLEPGEVVGRSALEMYADVPGFLDAFHRALAGEQTVLTSSAGDSEFEAIYAPSIDSRGRIDGVISVAFDITDRTRAEAQLRAAAEAQTRLVEELREADRRKNDFIAVLSHELRNPLSAIQSGLYLLDRVSAASERERRAIDILQRQVTQLTRLVDDLLDVSRITRDRIQLQRASLDLAQLVRTVVDDHRQLFASHGVTLELSLTGAPVMVSGDAARLTQVIGNLLHNAGKFTPRGGRTTVSLAADRAAGRAVLHVIDTGAGIDAAMLEQMFRPFAQADRTLARSMGGLGLGLALVKGLVDLHGGEVTVHSAGAGRGADFAVQLPLEQLPERASAPEAGRARQPESRRILVIEDNVDAAETLSAILELDGHTVEVAHDGTAGIKIAREHRPDIVLCDLGLPDVSGYEVARALKQDEALRSTLLAAVSGYAAPEDVARARTAGFDVHIAKPIALDRLRGLVSTLR